ncbi:HD domain-containing protein [Deinococcus taeanensis]|uniref:HD domain-containing phosphohydrolase n=1 Tax=Deinococcus taeanensis TaxID=2737050 RepID=UPI001CDD0274|nr:HD domain-containing phosphohydrolase [Deinococcus taeanensis]UBV44051.1 HD domain-containing protein [Deinococcus taeanensis]
MPVWDPTFSRPDHDHATRPPGDWAQALREAEQAEQAARAAGEDLRVARALLRRGQALNQLDQPHAALHALLEGVGFTGTIPALQAALWREAARAQLNLACDTDAQDYLSLALRLARDAGDHALELDLLDDIAHVQAMQGDLSAARHTLHASARLRRALPHQPGLTSTLVRLTQAELDSQPVPLSAAQQQRRRTDLLAAAHDPQTPAALQGDLWAALARLALLHPDPAAAQQAAQEALKHLTAPRATLRVHADLARAEQALGEGQAALKRLNILLRQAPPLHLLAEHAQLHLVACELCESLGEHVQALAHHRAYHALDAQRRDTHQHERMRAAQARLHLNVTRHEAHLNRVRGDELETLVESRTAELRRSHRAVVDLLASAAEFRDAPLGPHTRWVGDATTAVALELGCEPLHAQELGLAARLHDVGKIGIPDAILLKDGPLTAQERRVIGTHTTLGANLLTQPGATDGGPLLRLAAQIALSHHECWNGTGYPNGLSGSAIPLGGRIVRVVDAFDALVSERPYKPAWDDADALAYLHQHAGTLFDPAAVQAFTALHDSGRLPLRTPDRDPHVA